MGIWVQAKEVVCMEKEYICCGLMRRLKFDHRKYLLVIVIANSLYFIYYSRRTLNFTDDVIN